MNKNTDSLDNFRSFTITDFCSGKNNKISYAVVKDSSCIRIEKSDISPWQFSHTIRSLIKGIFLPKGYPHSVSRDYLEYQIWDTCQAFCSSISGTLTIRAVMQGIGVGSGAATPASAATTWLMKDGTGMMGSIMFAWFKGSVLDADCKKWRLFADILNDTAMFIELYSPILVNYSMYLLCIATTLKAIVGIAGSSTRAALVTHQAIKGNTADVSAKDGSQEIFTNLFGFIFGILLLKNVTDTESVWAVMCTATLFHLIFNYKAVRCLKMNVFNRERFRLCLRTYLPTSCVPSVAHINEKESVFLLKGTSDYSLCGYSIVFGASLEKAFKTHDLTSAQISSVMNLFHDRSYFIFPNNKKRTFYVSFREDFNDDEVLRAYFHAFMLAISVALLDNTVTLKIISRTRKGSPVYRLKNLLKEFEVDDQIANHSNSVPDPTLLAAYMCCDEFIDKEYSAFRRACVEEGWDVHKHQFVVGEWRTEWSYQQPKKEKKMPRRVPPQNRVSIKAGDMNVLVIA